MSDRRIVGKSIRKKDAMRLLLGKPAFVEDVTRPDALVVKVLRSPHANAVIREISTQRAMTVPGIEAIYTYQDVPQKRFTMAGQTYPEPGSPCALCRRCSGDHCRRDGAGGGSCHEADPGGL